MFVIPYQLINSALFGFTITVTGYHTMCWPGFKLNFLCWMHFLNVIWARMRAVFCPPLNIDMCRSKYFFSEKTASLKCILTKNKSMVFQFLHLNIFLTCGQPHSLQQTFQSTTDLCRKVPSYFWIGSSQYWFRIQEHCYCRWPPLLWYCLYYINFLLHLNSSA